MCDMHNAYYIVRRPEYFQTFRRNIIQFWWNVYTPVECRFSCRCRGHHQIVLWLLFYISYTIESMSHRSFMHSHQIYDKFISNWIKWVAYRQMSDNCIWTLFTHNHLELCVWFRFSLPLILLSIANYYYHCDFAR